MTRETSAKFGCLLLLSSMAASSGCSDAVDGSKCEPNTKCGSEQGDASTDLGENIGGGADVRGGGDGPTGPAPRASVSLHIQEYDSTDPTHGMDRCPPGRHWINVPYQRERAPSTQTQQTTNAVVAATAVNGQDNDSVVCLVRQSGDRFSVSADANGYASTDIEKRKPSIVHIRIPSIGPNESNAAGALSVQDDATLTAYTTMQCTFSTEGGSLGVKSGGIWGAVRCEDLLDPALPGSACQVDVGFFLFENCAQQ
jgi:hypothetical protein